MNILFIAIAWIGAYLLGSISTAIIACKFLGLPDPRTQGSKNAGATNASRIGGNKVGIMVLIGDILKGVIPVLAAKLLGLPGWAIGFTAVLAVVGHLFPVFFQFKGGKGVATAFGVIAILSFPVCVGMLTVFAIIFLATRYVSLGSISAAISAPIFSLFLAPTAYFAPLIIIAVLIVWKHKENMQRLLKGQEDKQKLGS